MIRRLVAAIARAVALAGRLWLAKSLMLPAIGLVSDCLSIRGAIEPATARACVCEPPR